MNRFVENFISGVTWIGVFATLSVFTFAQPTSLPAPHKSRPASTTAFYGPELRSSPTPEPNPKPDRNRRQTTEKSLRVDSGVKITLDCVTEGTVKINGWNRNEVRMLIADGTKFNLKVAEKSLKTGDPIWIKVTGAGTRSDLGPSNECISGNEIEIDLPMNATVSVKGGEVTTIIDSVKKAEVETNGGDITLRNIPSGTKVTANRGDITVQESGGGMSLVTTTGNIFVFEAGPSEPGDVFRANTHGGSISLQKLEYRQIDVRSISGSVAFNGNILSGGSYTMNTTKGSIRLSIPSDSSCVLTASYGYGSFNTDIPIKISTENITSGQIKSIVGTLGKGGDAVLKLSSTSGSIGIKKQ